MTSHAYSAYRGFLTKRVVPWPWPVLAHLALVPCGVLIAYQPAWAAAGGIALLLIAGCVIRPDLGLAAAVLSVYWARPLGEDALHYPASIVAVTPTALGAAAWLGYAIRYRRGHVRLNEPVHLALAAFLIVGLASAVANGLGLPALLQSSRNYLGYVLILYVILLSGAQRAWLLKLLWLMIGGMAIQLPIQLYQALRHGRGGDWASGTLGAQATGVFAVIAVMLACIVVGMAVETRSPRLTWCAAAFSTVIVIELIVGEAKFGLIVLPLALLVTVAGRVDRRRAAALASATVVAWLLLLVLVPLFTPSSPLLGFLTNPLSVLNYEHTDISFTHGGQLSRITQVTFAWGLLGPDIGRVLLGYGPGSATGSFIAYLRGSLWLEYGRLYGFAASQLSSTLLEYGALGFATYMAAVVAPLGYCRRLWRNRHEDALWRGVAVGFRGALFVFLVGSVYLKAWNTQVAEVFWTLAALCLVVAPRTPRQPATALETTPGPINHQALASPPTEPHGAGAADRRNPWGRHSPPQGTRCPQSGPRQ